VGASTVDVVVRVVLFGLGTVVVVAVLGLAVRTVVLPRGVQARLTALVFVAVRHLFRLRLGLAPSYERRDRVMAPYAPLSLLTLTLVWLLLVGAGYTAMFWALETRSVRESVVLSGSSLLTLGFVRPHDLPAILLTFSEAAIGLALLALIITYLPSLYTSFSRREAAVAHLEVRAGSSTSGVEIIERYALIGRPEGLADLWDRWEDWFVEVEETHTSFPALVFFRSPQPEHSWVTAVGALLDAAALASSTLDEHDPDAALTVRAGYLSLRRIADYSASPTTPSPAATTPSLSPGTSTTAPTTASPPRASDSSPTGTRGGGTSPAGVNYDTVLVSLASLVMAPYAPWSSDRSVTRFRMRVLPSFRLRGRARPGRAGGQ
jgi:hypothetical protein